MKRKTAISCLVLACLAGVAMAALQVRTPAPQDGPDLQDMLNTPKTALQMQLYMANRDPATGKSVSGKLLGFEDYKDNGKTKYHVRNLFEDGASEELYFRDDGSTEKAFEYFPPQQDALPLLHGSATFEADGKTYKSHLVFNDKGARVRQGQLLSNGAYQQTYFCADSTKPERVRLFNEKKEFTSEKLYDCKTGTLLAEVLPSTYYGQVKVMLYRADGTLKADLVRDYQGIGGKVFDSDGKTVLYEYRDELSSRTVTKYTADGKVTELATSSFGRTRIATYDPATGQRIRYQEWKERPGENGGPNKLLLTQVTEYSNDAANVPTRVVEMTGDGKLPASVSVPLPADVDLKSLALPKVEGGLEQLEKLRSQMHLVKTLAPDGTVSKTELTIDYQSWNNTVQPSTAAEQIHVAPQLLSMPQGQVELPRFDNLGPDRVYDYGTNETPNSWPSSYQQRYNYGFGMGGP